MLVMVVLRLVFADSTFLVVGYCEAYVDFQMADYELPADLECHPEYYEDFVAD
jgi:hypothetical protein